MLQTQEIDKIMKRESLIAEALVEYYHNNKETLTREEITTIQDIMIDNNNRDHAIEIDADLDRQLQEQKEESKFYPSQEP